MITKSIWTAIKTFWDDDPFTHASSIAFYTIISLPAILILCINFLSLAYESIDVQRDLLHKLNTYLGPNTVDQATEILKNVQESSDSLYPQIMSFVVIVFSATTVFISLQNGVNQIWGEALENTSNSKLRFIFDRLRSLALILSIGFIFLVMLLIDSVLSIFTSWLDNNYSQVYLIVAWAINFIVNFGVTVLVFTFIFKLLPVKQIPWNFALVGGVITSLLFLIGKFLIGYYLSSVDVGSAYGASGSMVIFLSWVYYSSTLILFGSKITYEYYKLANLASSGSVVVSTD